MKRWLDLVTRHRLGVALVAALIAAIGLWSFANLQIDAIPDITGFRCRSIPRCPRSRPRRSSGW